MTNLKPVTNEEMAEAWAEEGRARREHWRRREAVEQAKKDQARAWDDYYDAVRVRRALMTLREATEKA